jgi:transcriptional regulator with XRE-family HTH domain
MEVMSMENNNSNMRSIEDIDLILRERLDDVMTPYGMTRGIDHVTAVELARRTGLKRSTLSAYKSKRESIPKADVLAMIAEATNTTPNWLLGFDDDIGLSPQAIHALRKNRSVNGDGYDNYWSSAYFINALVTHNHFSEILLAIKHNYKLFASVTDNSDLDSDNKKLNRAELNEYRIFKLIMTVIDDVMSGYLET